jgi:hypothetical protein
MFPVYGGKCLSGKAVHNWVEKHGKRLTDDEEVEMEERKWLKQQSKYFCTAGSDALVKRWEKCSSVAGGYVEKYMLFFSVSNITCFAFLYQFMTYLLTLSHTLLPLQQPA